MNSIMTLTAWGLMALVSAFVGSYVGAYMRRKGENLATHEDIDKLRDQVRMVTTTTKEIEAKISHELWDRQKRWELRRDALFELAKKLGLLKDSLTLLLSAYQTDSQHGWQNDPNRTANRIKVGQDWLDKAAALDNAIMAAGIVCDGELTKLLLGSSLAMRQIVSKAKEWDTETLANGTTLLGSQLGTVMDAIRQELNRASRV